MGFIRRLIRSTSFKASYDRLRDVLQEFLLSLALTYTSVQFQHFSPVATFIASQAKRLQ